MLVLSAGAGADGAAAASTLPLTHTSPPCVFKCVASKEPAKPAPTKANGRLVRPKQKNDDH
jgi:hypothetical protein